MKLAHVVNAVLVLFLVACGTEYRTVEVEKKVKVLVEKPFYINPDLVDTPLMPHVMEFAGYCERFKTTETCKKNFEKVLSIRLVPSFSDDQFVVGKCFVAQSGERWIEVLDKVIDYDSLTMKTLVMHEVGHCVLGSPFPHYNEKVDIMNSYLLPEKIIQTSWPTLIKRMFTRAGGTLSLTNEPEVTTVTSTVMNESGGFSCEKED